MGYFCCEWWDPHGPPFCTLPENTECPYPIGGCYEDDGEECNLGCDADLDCDIRHIWR